MCVVSMVGDHYRDMWEKQQPWYPQPIVQPPALPLPFIVAPQITREEFDQLKRQVEEMKQLLIRAKIYDEQNNEPDCEIDEKMELLRKIAKVVGVDLDDVIGRK